MSAAVVRPEAEGASARRLALSHMWIAFALFAVGTVLGLYQLLEREGLVPTSAPR